MDILSWFDTQMMIIYVCIAVAIWAGIKSFTTGKKTWIFILGASLAVVGITCIQHRIRNRHRRLGDELDDDIEGSLNEEKKIEERLADQANLSAVEAEKSRIELEKLKRIRAEKEKAKQELLELLE
jgi:low affinity Fe/Cu permease